MSALPNYESISALPRVNASLRSTLGAAGKLCEQSLSLLERILVYDPERRTTARLALGNPFFSNVPDDPLKLEPLSTYTIFPPVYRFC
jgi:hypothetical protein